MKKIIFVLLILILVAIVIFLVVRKPSESISPPIDKSIILEEANVFIQNFSFNPAEVVIKIGGKVAWLNKDSAPHSVEINGMKSANLSKGDSFEFIFNKAGEYDYICGIHPYMKGNITVVE